MLAAFAQFDNDWMFMAPIGYINAPRATGKGLMADPERAPHTADRNWEGRFGASGFGGWGDEERLLSRSYQNRRTSKSSNAWSSLTSATSSIWL